MTDENRLEDIESILVDNDYMAEVRTSLARSRTYLAAERTFAAWIRTGFAIAGAGVTLGTALNDTESRELSWAIGGSLIFVGLYCFIFAWRGYKNIHEYITRNYEKRGLEAQSFSFHFFTISLITLVLSVASILGFYLMFT